jgi:hypothetical protein
VSRQISPFFVAVKALPTAPSVQHLSRQYAGLRFEDCTGYDLWHTGVRHSVIAGVYPAPVKKLSRAYRQHDDVAVYASLQ